MNKLYKVRLRNYGLPNFCRGKKDYIGHKYSINRILSRLDGRSDIIDSGDLFRGDLGFIGVLYKQPQPIISEVRVFKVIKGSKENFEYEYFNAFGNPYVITADKIEYILYYTVDETLDYGKYCRYVKVKLYNIKSVRTQNVRHLLGHFDIIRRVSNNLSNRIYGVDMVFDTLEELKEDIENPCGINLDDFFSDICESD